MIKSIDLKSLLIGSLLTLLVLCVLGAAPRLLPSPGPAGRYALVISHITDDNTYVIDTTTGQVWPRFAQGRTDAFYAPKLKVQAPAEPNQPDTR